MNKRKQKKSKSTPKGRGHVARKTSRGIAKIVSHIPAGFADEAEVTLKFSDSYLVAQGATGGTASSLTFSMNSLFQCNVTAASGQPQYYTQYSAVYQKYVVTHSRIRWRLRQLGGGIKLAGVAQGAGPGSSAMPVSVLYPGPSGASTASSVRSAAAQQYSRRHEFNVEAAGGVSQTGTQQGNARVEWVGSHSMGVSKIEGEPMLRTATYEALVSANPSRQPTWTFIFQDVLSDSAFEGVFLMEVDIYYAAKFFDRILASDSSCGPLRVVTASSAEEKKVPPPTLSWTEDDDLVLVNRQAVAAALSISSARAATSRSTSLK
jgi:hypothetical protein